MFDQIDQLGVNTIRTLSIDAIQKANSGHPGSTNGVRSLDPPYAPQSENPP